MTDIAKKVKEKLEDVKDKAIGFEHAAREKTEDYTNYKENDPTREYESKEPMSPAKINEHEPTAVRRENTTNTSVPTSEADAKERLRMVENEYPQFLHGIPWMAKEPGVALQTPVTHEHGRYFHMQVKLQGPYLRSV